MARALSFFVFFSIAILVVGTVHYYIWARLVRDAHLPVTAHRALTAAFAVLFLATPLTLWGVRALRPELAKPIALVAFSWLGLLFLLFVLVACSELLRLGVAVWNRVSSDPVDPERRLTLARLLAGGTAVVAAGLGVFSFRSGFHRFLIRDVSVRLERLPKALDGLRVAQLSDIHVGPTLGREFVQSIVDATNGLEPDVVAITGDLVDGSVEQLREHVAPLGQLRARYGVFFVTGNHEFYSGADEWCSELTRLGIRVLRNERVEIGDAQASFDLAGIEDYNAGRFGSPPRLDKALAGRDPRRELVLLAHQPRAIFEAERLGVGLQLSGHTHGGQLFPWNYLVRLQQPVVSGLARIGRALVYVSNGTGFWGPPMRLGIPAEITNLVLRSDAAELV